MKKILAVFLILLSLNVRASESPLNVVKIISFSCNVCRGSEVIDPALSRAVRAQGGQFVWAPIPVAEKDFLGVKERVYYASRSVSPDIANRVKDSMYKASQDMLVPLDTFSQAYSWLIQDLQLNSDLAQKIINEAQSPEGIVPLRRAFLLVQEAGISAVPSYLILKNGKVIKSLDPTKADTKSFSDLRDAVLAEISKKD